MKSVVLRIFYGVCCLSSFQVGRADDSHPDFDSDSGCKCNGVSPNDYGGDSMTVAIMSGRFLIDNVTAETTSQIIQRTSFSLTEDRRSRDARFTRTVQTVKEAARENGLSESEIETLGREVAFLAESVLKDNICLETANRDIINRAAACYLNQLGIQKTSPVGSPTPQPPQSGGGSKPEAPSKPSKPSKPSNPFGGFHLPFPFSLLSQSKETARAEA